MAQYLKTVDSNWYKQRLNNAIICILLAFVLLFARIFYLQVIEGEEYRRLSENNSIRLRSIDPSRGLIFDRNGERLVDNRPSFDLSIILKDAGPTKPTIEKLSGYMSLPPEELASKISDDKHLSSYQPILLKTGYRTGCTGGHRSPYV